jgi:hypothetical protein
MTSDSQETRRYILLQWLFSAIAKRSSGFYENRDVMLIQKQVL